MKKVFWIFIVLLGFFTLFVIYPLSSDARPIKVGIIDCYSGPATTFTYDVRDAFKIAVDEVNAKGGVLGKKLEFTTRDTKCKVDLGIS
ncbi:MAG: amino acid ABC transporter substrate-binding protein, partial [Deltaproteobacteria bacterium]